MTDTSQRSHKRVEIIVPRLFIGGGIAVLLGTAGLAIGFKVAGLSLLFGGLAAIAFAHCSNYSPRSHATWRRSGRK